MNATQQKIELMRIQFDIILNEIAHDDTQAQYQALGIVINALSQLECMYQDQRPKCEDCNERMNPEDNAGNDLCLNCSRDLRSELVARENAYQAR